MTVRMEEELEFMCNLSDGVEQKGIQKGIILTLCSLVRDNVLTLEDAAKRAKMSVEEFKGEIKQ